MSWISEHVNEVAAIGSIGMNVATLVIIFFNLTQFRLNRRTLNIEVNFKVFELRKKIYRDIDEFVNNIKSRNDFSNFIDYELKPPVANKSFSVFKDTIEDSKYLFSPNLTAEIESLLLQCEYGISTECELERIKDGDPSGWTEADTKQIQDLAQKKQEIIESISYFEIEQFLEYLNISNFDQDFISEKRFIFQRRPLIWFRGAASKIFKGTTKLRSAPKLIEQ